MKVPMKWLAEFVQTGLAPKELAHRMTMAGLEAEKLEVIGAIWDNVFVGDVRRVERHPNADRLVLAEVEAGEHHLTVVTGAPNIAQGQKVALALAGARLYDGHSESPTPELKTLKPGMIRGVKSEGMVCSEKELGISDEHEGILVLEPDAPVGVPLRDYLGDTVIEFEITPNLVHAFSIQGIAREAGALTGASVSEPSLVDLASLPKAAPNLVTIEANDLCSRYMAMVFENLEVGPSPDWLARRITAAGMRPISNIVDVTNYVMHEIGQPLHAFDLDALDERRIVIRRARAGEKLETLDHVERSLTDDMLVIADAHKAIGLAGVMGGFNSEISDSTKTVILEGANFNMTSVRQTARALKHRTDASARFERGLDPNLVAPAMARATRLLLELCPNARVTAVADVYPNRVAPRSLSMPLRKIATHLGVEYADSQILEALTPLGFDPRITGDDANRLLSVSIPTVRRDVSIPEDIVEEVARVIGYESLPATLPSGRAVPVKRDPAYELRKNVRDILVGVGGAESVTYVTVGEEDLKSFTTEGGSAGFLHEIESSRLLRVINPLQSGKQILRPTLIPSLVANVAQNLKHAESVRQFEIAHVYLPNSRDELPREPDTLAVAIAGKRAETGLHADPGELDFFDIKGIADELCGRFAIRAEFSASSHPALHPGRSAVISVGEQLVGRLGELHPSVATEFGIEDARVGVLEIDLEAVRALIPHDRRELFAPKFLPAQQDFAVVVDENVSAESVRGALTEASGPLASGFVLFDIFRGSQIGEGKKSLAYRITFTAPDRALTDAELTKIRPRIEKVLKQRVGGVLRG